MLADLPGEQHLAPLALGRLALGDDLHRRAVLEVEVAVLHQQAAHDALEVALGDVEVAALVVLEDAHVRLGGEDLERLLGEARGEDDLAELLDERLGELLVDRAVDGHHAAERRQRVAREGALVGLDRRARRRRTPHGLLCLMIAQAGSSNSWTSRRAELRSSTLLNDSSRPPSWRTIESTCMRAPACA